MPSAPSGSDPLILGLDLGTSRIKALLLDREGEIRGSASVPMPFQGGEMPVDRLVGGLRDVFRGLGGGCRRVAGVGIAGIAESGAPLDRDGRPSAPVIVWHDPRGAEVVERLLRQFGPDLEHRIGQRLRTVSSVAKLGWLVDHGVGPVAGWLGVPELALHALTGDQVTEFSLAARTGAYDVRARQYLPEVAEALGVAPDVFPVVAAAGQAMGRMSRGAAAWSGLAERIPVTVAGHDHLVGLVGSGAGPGDWGNSVGTAETVVAPARDWPDTELTLSLRVAVTVMPGGHGWALQASAARSGLLVDMFAESFGRSPEALDRELPAAKLVPVGGDLIDAALRGESIHLPSELQVPELQVAVWNRLLDELAVRTWGAVDRLQQAAPAGRGGDPTGLVVFGGGSRSRPWLAAKAAARPGIPVWRSGVSEAVARGAAILAGVASSWWPAVDCAPPAPRERIPSE